MHPFKLQNILTPISFVNWNRIIKIIFILSTHELLNEYHLILAVNNKIVV